NALVPEFRRLSQQFGVQDAALVTFFRILGTQQVPVEDLDTALRQIAGRHLELQRQIAALSADDPAQRALRQRAEAAVARGAYDEATRLLEEVEAADLTAAQQLQAEAEQRQLNAAAARARQGQIVMLSFRYAEARAHYERAVQLVPAGRIAVR